MKSAGNAYKGSVRLKLRENTKKLKALLKRQKEGLNHIF